MKQGADKKIVLFIALSMFLLFVLPDTSRAQEERGRGPKISVDQPFFDLGRIDEGKPIMHTYVVKNLGNEDLQIERVWTS